MPLPIIPNQKTPLNTDIIDQLNAYYNQLSKSTKLVTVTEEAIIVQKNISPLLITISLSDNSSNKYYYFTDSNQTSYQQGINVLELLKKLNNIQIYQEIKLINEMKAANNPLSIYDQVVDQLRTVAPQFVKLIEQLTTSPLDIFTFLEYCTTINECIYNNAQIHFNQKE